MGPVLPPLKIVEETRFSLELLCQLGFIRKEKIDYPKGVYEVAFIKIIR